MLDYYGFKAAIICDNKRLSTLKTAKIGRTASGWVASEVGKTFALAIEQYGTSASCYTVRVIVDGQEVDYVFSEPAPLTLTGIRPTPSTFAVLQFDTLKTTEEELDQAENPALGTIELRICRVIRTGYGGTCAAVRQAPSGATVNERRKRSVMGGLSVSTASTVKAEPIQTVTILPYSAKDPSPYVTFQFRYRSKEFLEAQRIIPSQQSMDSSLAPAANNPQTTLKRRRADAQPSNLLPEDANRTPKRLRIEESV